MPDEFFNKRFKIFNAANQNKMKLRMRGNSLRLRLTKNEVARIGKGGTVEETIDFGALSQKLIYRLTVEHNIENLNAVFDGGLITISIPRQQAEEWAQTDQTGIESEQSIGGDKSLRILVEKDFSCLEPRKGAEDADTFIHPFSKENENSNANS